MAAVGFAGAPLILEGFGRRFGRKRPWAVRGVSASVPRGSIAALVGPNGAGKSTLLRACLGFERPDEGRVLVCGIDPQRDRVGAVASTGYVPQAVALYRGLTIGDHIKIACAARPKFDRRAALEGLGRIGLDETRKVGQLSGGEQARVSLELAMASRPPLLLLDEPLASLDPLARRDFLATLVQDVRGRGATAVLSSHIVTDIEQACDRLIVLVSGGLALDVAIEEAKRRFRTITAPALDSVPIVGRFIGAEGEALALTADVSLGRPSSLEEITLGHLAAAPAKPTVLTVREQQ